VTSSRTAVLENGAGGGDEVTTAGVQQPELQQRYQRRPLLAGKRSGCIRSDKSTNTSQGCGLGGKEGGCTT